MDVLAVPRRVIVIGIQPPCQDETRSMLIAVLELVHRLADAVGELTISRIALGIVMGRSVIWRSGIRGVGRCSLLGVGPDARQRRQPLAFRGLARASGQFCRRQLGKYLSHCLSPR